MEISRCVLLRIACWWFKDCMRIMVRIHSSWRILISTVKQVIFCPERSLSLIWKSSVSTISSFCWTLTYTRHRHFCFLEARKKCFCLFTLLPESIRPPRFALRTAKWMNERSRCRVKAYVYVCAPRYSYACVYFPFGAVLWNAPALPRSIFCTRWLVHFPVYPASPPPRWSRSASTFSCRSSSSPLFPIALSLSLILSKISKPMTRRGRTRAVLFEQRVTFLAWWFPIEMLMKSDDPRTSRDAVTRDATLRCSLLSQLLTTDCASSRFLAMASNFASSNYTSASHCIFAEQARVHWI